MQESQGTRRERPLAAPTTRLRPFQGITVYGWMRLACAALAMCYLLQVAIELVWHNTCGHLAIDYCATWSAGRVANAYGYARVYDLNTLGQVEASIAPTSATYAIAVSPIAYLPIFIVPFQLLSKLDPAPSYWLWVVANLLILVLYLRFFIRRTTGSRLSPTILTLAMLSLPVYWNWFDGQVNVWLVICAGEALQAGLAKQPFREGLWLAGLLLKPQLLILVVLVLIIQRAWRVLSGLVVAAFAALALSWLMIGTPGYKSLLGLWLGFSRGMPTNDVSIMMNWRMIGTTLGALSTPLVEWITIAAGSLATLVASVFLWQGRPDIQSDEFGIAWLGLLAAATVFAWHSHVHTAMIVLPSLLYLAARKALSFKILACWVIVPTALYFAAFFTASLIQTGLLPASMSFLVNFARGVGEFAMSVFLLIWAVNQRRSATRPPELTANTVSLTS